jgi:hypothetical protein
MLEKKLNTEIVQKISVLNKFTSILIFSALILGIGLKIEVDDLNFERNNQNLIIIVIFTLLITMFVFSFIRIFDDKPILKINENGVFYRSTFLPFLPLSHLEWNEIEFVELKIVRYSKHSRGKGLLIYKKSSLNSKTIHLEDLDYPENVVLNIFRKHSNFLNSINKSEIKAQY